MFLKSLAGGFQRYSMLKFTNKSLVTWTCATCVLKFWCCQPLCRSYGHFNVQWQGLNPKISKNLCSCRLKIFKNFWITPLVWNGHNSYTFFDQIEKFQGISSSTAPDIFRTHVARDHVPKNVSSSLWTFRLKDFKNT